MPQQTEPGRQSGGSTGDSPLVEALAVGQLAANCYLLICPTTREAALLDPGDEPERILERVQTLGIAVTHVLHTHGHFDHISATEAVLAGLPPGVRLGAHPADAFLYGEPALAMAAAFGYPVPASRAMPTLALEDGTEVAIGTLRLRVLHTPGHTPGGVSLLCAPWCVFSGDTLFRRGIGRTDLEGGDEDALYTSIETRLYPLDPSLVVYPGHGAPTTIDEERRLNPFVRG
ncbi:MAG: MBL fold metallo-hydrolase [Ktedonobacterales bacterium]